MAEHEIPAVVRVIVCDGALQIARLAHVG